MLGVSANYIYMLEKGIKFPSTQLSLGLDRLLRETGREESESSNLVREGPPVDLTKPSPLKHALETELRRMHAAAAAADDWASVAAIGLELQSRKPNGGITYGK